MYGNNKPTMNTDTITSNANSTFDKYAEKSNTEESESLLEKDIQVRQKLLHMYGHIINNPLITFCKKLDRT